jgi:KDO2-lipid IV(A) lauroyltransferase
MFLFLIFKIIGLRYSLILSSYTLKIFGPLFRSNKISNTNIALAMPSADENARKKIIENMWVNYGKILSEYMFIKNFRTDTKYSEKINILNKDVLDKIKSKNKPVIFVSGHFNNFELMAMSIEKSSINLAAVYRPLNNIFLNPIMEKIRKKYICKNQIKKGKSGNRELLKFFKNNVSIALMIDQRVSQGIESNFFNKKALTTTIPAQFVKKFNAEIVPVYIERIENDNFNIKFFDPIRFKEDQNTNQITEKLNKILEEMILKNPDQWIWTHNRWK